jgi:DNA-binding SARP family transcriptional activator
VSLVRRHARASLDSTRGDLSSDPRGSRNVSAVSEGTRPRPGNLETCVEVVTFGLLGPVELRVPGRSAVALPPSVRALLARLALSPGRVVSVDTLTDALWGEDLPADAGNALQVRVSKLRRALIAAGVPGEVLVTRAPGYMLAVEPAAVDVRRFEHLLASARRFAADRSPAEALESLNDALALWRGPSLGDVGDADWIEAENARLEELRIGALEDRLELLLDLGR